MRIEVILMLGVGLVACGGPASLPRRLAAPPTPASEPQFIETTDLPPSGELPPKGMQGNRIGEPTSVPVPTGPLTKDEIRAVMQRNRDSYRKCYERELLKNPSLAGTIAMEFVIQADGAVASASIASTTIGSPAVEQCVADAVKQLVFPPTQGGGSEKVSYPLVFVTNRP